MRILLTLLLAVSCYAQSNTIPELTVAGKTYHNARIDRATASHAIIYFDGGIAKVALSNMPPAFQKQYGYDPAKASKAIKEEADRESAKRIASAKLAAQNQTAENAKAASSQMVSVFQIISNIGYDKCDTSAGTILISGLPSQTKDFFNRESALSAAISDHELAADRNEAALERANATTPTGAGGSPEFVNAVMAKRNQINLALIDAKNERKNISKLTQSLTSLQSARKSFTSITAYSTGQSYAGVPIWKCIGIALEEKEVTSR